MQRLLEIKITFLRKIKQFDNGNLKIVKKFHDNNIIR